MTRRPLVICLCGSTKFADVFREQEAKLTLEGYIVLSIGVGRTAPDGGNLGDPDSPTTRRTKAKLDVLHLRKIDLADTVYVLNVNGYIGESTEREIEYAISTGKNVAYLEVA
jgi:hypothetical protein